MKVKVMGKHSLEIRPDVAAKSSRRMKPFTSTEFIYPTVRGQSAGLLGPSYLSEPLLTWVLCPPGPSPGAQHESTGAPKTRVISITRAFWMFAPPTRASFHFQLFFFPSTSSPFSKQMLGLCYAHSLIGLTFATASGAWCPRVSSQQTEVG